MSEPTRLGLALRWALSVVYCVVWVAVCAMVHTACKTQQTQPPPALPALLREVGTGHDYIRVFCDTATQDRIYYRFNTGLAVIPKGCAQ